MRKIAEDIFWPEMAGYYIFDSLEEAKRYGINNDEADKCVWHCSGSIKINEGDIARFVEMVKSGNIRAKLISQNV